MKVTNKTSEVIELIREIVIYATSPYSENHERLNLENDLLDIRDYIDEILRQERPPASRRDEYINRERTDDMHMRQKSIEKRHRPSKSIQSRNLQKKTKRKESIKPHPERDLERDYTEELRAENERLKAKNERLETKHKKLLPPRQKRSRVYGPDVEVTDVGGE